MGSASGLPTDVYNLGCGESITINKLAQMMIEISGKKTEIQYAPERPADVKHCKANAEKAFEKLGFRTEVSLEDGLQQYMQWYQENCVR